MAYKIYKLSNKIYNSYTVIEDDAEPCKFSKCVPCLNIIGDDPDKHTGVSMFGEALEGDHLGEAITLESLPLKLQQLIKKRFENDC